MRGRHHLADEHPDRRTGGTESGGDEGHHGDDPETDLDQEVDRKWPVGPVRLQEAPVEREQDEEGGRREDRRNANAALLVQQNGDTRAGS